MRRWPCPIRCRTAAYAPCRLSTSTVSTFRFAAGRSTQTILTPSSCCARRNRWLPAAGTRITPSTRRAQNAEMTSRSRARLSFELPMSTTQECSRAVSSTARASVAKNGLAMSSTSRPIVWVGWEWRRS